VEAGTILAVGLILACPWEERYREQVLLLHGDGDELEAAEVDIRTFGREGDLLAALRRRVLEWDPDIVTGWNVVDFDLRVIAARFAVHDLPLILGRARVPDVFLDQTRALGSRMIIHGRQVLDGVRLVRAGPVHFPDYSLDTVAYEVLGYGKSLSQAEQENKLASLRRLYREEPARFCAYCAQDARLVLEILEKTGLLELTLRRCRLTGVSLERAWTSIAAFEYLYIEALHERGVVAPSPGVDSLPLEATPGGAILPPQPGLYDNVFVFDFRSLYPSIIMTFNIDPLSLVRLADRSALDASEEARMIRAPNGALFRREPAILPRLLDRFFQGRVEAKARGDAVASYVYKIIMNSFYGVLGASGCRFAGSELAGAITSFGHSILSWCHSTFAEEGYRVLYGDTDSLFVLSSHPADTPPGELYRTGRELCLRMNERLEEHLSSTVQVESRLVLELEKIYARFFLPRIRGGGRAGVADRSPRGRAKGHAGLPLEEGGRVVPPAELPLEIVGMEAVRRDWTGLARQLQIRLLRMIFERTPREQVQSYIRGLVEELYPGALDESLVYVKALRKPVSEYRHSLPPHVRAAAQLDRSAQRGLIHYVWTKDGPQPADRWSSAPDYDHYLEKQLRPIASVFADALDLDIDRMLSADQQQWLF